MSIARTAAVSVAFFAAALSSTAAGAAGYRVLWNFPSAATGGPESRLLFHAGILYGTTAGSAAGDGQVFELARTGGAWSATTLLSFSGANGSNALAGVTLDSSGALYGTTFRGGTQNAGIAFELAQSGGQWNETALHSFGSGNDATEPMGCLVRKGAIRTLYGTAEAGGANGEGAIFALTSAGGTWSEKLLYSFQGADDGGAPWGGLVRDSSGALYGATQLGGANGAGTAFGLALSHGKWSETTLHAFGSGNDGKVPVGELVEAPNGVFYGVTIEGGTNSAGTVYALSQSGGQWTETVVWNFGGSGDGAYPDAGVLLDKSGTFYGTTGQGGVNGKGTVYALKQSGGTWTETVLHSFGGSGDGAYPGAPLVEDGRGRLYGTTPIGGSAGNGTVFRLKP